MLALFTVSVGALIFGSVIFTYEWIPAHGALVIGALIGAIILYKSLAKTRRLYYKMNKLSLQEKFGYNYKGFVKTKFWKRKRHIKAFHLKLRKMVTIISLLGFL